MKGVKTTEHTGIGEADIIGKKAVVCGRSSRGSRKARNCDDGPIGVQGEGGKVQNANIKDGLGQNRNKRVASRGWGPSLIIIIKLKAFSEELEQAAEPDFKASKWGW